MRMERSLALGPLPLKDDMCPVIWATLCESDNEFDVFTGLEPDARQTWLTMPWAPPTTQVWLLSAPASPAQISTA